MSSKSSKRRGRQIVVDGVKYYWKIRSSHDDLSVVDVLMPTGKRLKKAIQWSNSRKPITPKDVAAFIRGAIGS